MACLKPGRVFEYVHVALIVIEGAPIIKPKMPPLDRRAQRPCVLRYQAWCDRVRKAADRQPEVKRRLDAPTSVEVAAYFSHRTRDGPHILRPDGGSILRGVCDALFENPQLVYQESITKHWTYKMSYIVVTIGEAREWRPVCKAT